MAFLTPNSQYRINGVLVNEKIIPDGTVWKDSTKAKRAEETKGERRDKVVHFIWPPWENPGKKSLYLKGETNEICDWR